MTYLLFILCLCCWSIVSFLKQDLLHFTILQVVKLTYCILSPVDQVNKNRLWSLTLDKCMLREAPRINQSLIINYSNAVMWELKTTFMFVFHNHFLNCYLQELLRVRPILRNFLKARIYKVSEIIRPFERKKKHEKRKVLFFIYVIS